MRVDTLDLDGLKVKYLGDVHLGHVFKNGVPLHRRGERELSVLEQFGAELFYPGDAAVVVQVGDIFDRFAVSNDIEMAACQAICSAASQNDEVAYFFLRGNHDASKDLEKVSSFDILATMCLGQDNIHFVVDQPTTWWDQPGPQAPCLAFIPWHPVKTAAEMVAEVASPGQFNAVFGHWDINSFGGDEHNLIPVDELLKVTKLAVTGHDHKPARLKMGELDVIVTGSMQAYAHGEENLQEQELDHVYHTMTRAEFDELQATGVEWATNKCVRILLAPGEVLPADLDCLQLTAKRLSADGDEESLDVELGDFNMDNLFLEAFAEAGVSQAITDELFGKYKELRAA